MNGAAVIYDAAAIVVPGVPVGASLVVDAIKAGKYSKKALEVGQKIVAKGTKVINKVNEYVPKGKFKKKINDYWERFKGLFKKNKGTNNPNKLKLNLQFFAAKKLPTGALSGKDVAKFLKKEGFQVISQNGSHLKLKGPNGNITIVPLHGNKSLPKGTLESIWKQAGFK